MQQAQELKMKRIYILTAILLSAVVCRLQAQYSVYPVDAAPEKAVEKGIFYSLPQNGFEITLFIEETSLERGIYSDYAEQLLKLSAIKENTTSYRIKDVRIRNTAYPDPERTFCVQGSRIPALLINKNGILKGVNLPFEKFCMQDRKTHDKPQPPQKAKDAPAGELPGVYGSFVPVADLNIRARFDTIVTQRKNDTSLIIEKILRPRIDEKSLSEQARKMADLIFKIRSEKANLLYGLQEVPYPAGTLEFMYRQLETNERRYLECFTGTVHRKDLRRTFRIIPKIGQTDYPFAIFSPEEGLFEIDDTAITDAEDLLTLHLSALPFAGEEAVAFQTHQKISASASGFYYLIPRKMQASVRYDESELNHAEVFVAQWGECLQLPVRDGYRIKLDSENGSLLYFGLPQEEAMNGKTEKKK